MTATLAPTPEEIRQAEAAVQAEAERLAEIQRQAADTPEARATAALAERQAYAAALKDADRANQRTLLADTITSAMPPLDAAVWDALDALDAAASAVAAASHAREAAKNAAVEQIRTIGEDSEGRMRLGVVPVCDRYRLTSNQRYEISGNLCSNRPADSHDRRRS